MKYFSDEKIARLVTSLESLKHTWPTDDTDAGFNWGVDACLEELRAYFPEATKS